MRELLALGVSRKSFCEDTSQAACASTLRSELARACFAVCLACASYLREVLANRILRYLTLRYLTLFIRYSIYIYIKGMRMYMYVFLIDFH